MAIPKQAVFYRRRVTKGTLSLHGSVGIFEAVTLQDAALSALNDAKAATICLDLCEAQRLDMSALQIVCALQRDVQAAGRLFVVEPASTSVAAAWLQIGYTL